MVYKMKETETAIISLSDKIAISALIVSIIALLVSIAISLIGIWVQKKINRSNLEAIYFETIFKSYLLEIIPEKVSKIKFGTNNKLNNNYKELNDTMMEMVRKARYFSFSRPKFYNELTDMTRELEDYLIELSSKTIEQTTKQNEIIIKIEKLVGKIMVHINKNYSS